MNRILIAEDEERITSFLEKGFRSNGFVTKVAADGREALEMARSGEFDLLILDLGLPGMDGFDVLRELREYDTRLPVIILTARDTVTDTVGGSGRRRGRLRPQAVPVRGTACPGSGPAPRRALP